MVLMIASSVTPLHNCFKRQLMIWWGQLSLYLRVHTTNVSLKHYLVNKCKSISLVLLVLGVANFINFQKKYAEISLSWTSKLFFLLLFFYQVPEWMKHCHDCSACSLELCVPGTQFAMHAKYSNSTKFYQFFFYRNLLPYLPHVWWNQVDVDHLNSQRLRTGGELMFPISLRSCTVMLSHKFDTLARTCRWMNALWLTCINFFYFNFTDVELAASYKEKWNCRTTDFQISEGQSAAPLSYVAGTVHFIDISKCHRWQQKQHGCVMRPKCIASNGRAKLETRSCGGRIKVN